MIPADAGRPEIPIEINTVPRINRWFNPSTPTWNA